MASAPPPKEFDRLREAFQHRFEALSPHLKRIAQYALEDPNRFALQTVAETAQETGVQPSTLIRFAKVFGFSGFTEMQRVFRLRLIEGAAPFRGQIHEHRGELQEAAKDDPSAILNGFADASALALEHLKADIDGGALREAVRMMDGAKAIYVIGQRRAFPVAAYLAYGLIRLEYRCHLLDSVGGMVPQQVATMRSDDLLIAVSFAEYSPAGCGHRLRRPHPQGSRPRRHRFHDEPARPQLQPLFRGPRCRSTPFPAPAAPIVLAQSLIIALGYYRDARLEQAAAGVRKPARARARRQT